MTLTSDIRGRVLIGLFAAVLALTTVLAPDEASPQKKRKRQTRPNVVVVMVDDMAYDSLKYMPRVNGQLASRGVSFTRAFSSYPLCCPARATYLTGQYVHNHRVLTNQGPIGGFAKLNHANTLPVWLSRSGYITAHIGKYLNGYGSGSTPDRRIPQGWREWYGSVDDPDCCIGGTYTMYGYTLNENGRLRTYGHPLAAIPSLYQTDIYSAKAADFIRRRATSTKPFFLSVATLAPHAEGVIQGFPNPRPAPRHQGAFGSLPLPKPPSYNEADVSDKPAKIATQQPIGQAAEDNITQRYRSRLESLLAVDDMVGNIIGALKQKRELGKTIIMFTDDNGFHHGEHRVRQGKVHLYEESSRIPLIIRGPGIPRGKKRSQPVTLADVAPTITDAADARPGLRMDGRSLLPLAKHGRLQLGRGILIEAFDPAGGFVYRAVRTNRYIYALHGSNEEELYDLYADPFEVQSRHNFGALADVKRDLQSQLARLDSCRARRCGNGPAIKLRLSFRRGRGCASSGVLARIVDQGSGLPIVARFFVAGHKAGRDSSLPLQKQVKRRQLGTRGTRVRAIVTMRDGRVRSLQERVPGVC